MKLIVSQELFPENNIQIDLLDNPVVRGWFDKFYALQQEYKLTGVVYRMSVGDRISKSDNVIDSRYEHLKQLFVELKNTEVRIPLTIPPIPEKFNRDLRWCNTIHNVFIDLAMYFDTLPYHERNTRLWELAKDINITVHGLEHNTELTEAEKQVMTYSSHQYLQTNIDQSIPDLWFDISPEDQLKYHSTIGDTLYPVTFANTILGKTLLVAFLQGEDPMSLAVSGMTGNWGNIEIVLDNSRKTIYQSKEFLDWVKQTKFKHIPLEFPVGTINATLAPRRFYRTIKSNNSRFVYTFVE
jgi:hypothetical protein